MTSVRDRLTDAGYALGWSPGLPGAGILGPRRLPVRRGHRLAPPGARGPGARGEPAPRHRPVRDRQGTARAVPADHALLRPLLAGGVPAAGDRPAADPGRHARDRRGEPPGQPGRGTRGDHRPAAYRQLRAGRGLDHRPRGGQVHHGRRAAQARVPVPAVPRVPRRARHGGAPGQWRGQPVRRARPAAPGRRPGLPGLRPGRHRPRHRGGVLRRESADDGGSRRAGRADRRGPAPHHAVVRRPRLESSYL